MTAQDATDSSRDSHTNTQLEQFVLLAKNVRGAAAKGLVEQAVSAPGVYVFGELLTVPNIQDLEKNEDGKLHWALLNLFAYGTYLQYSESPNSFPPLSDVMQQKLRQLTLVSLASETRRISYATLLNTLQLANVRQLEDIIIDAIYKGIVQGKLDQRNQCLEVDNCRGRDVRHESLGGMINKLNDWSTKCEALLGDIEEQMRRADQKKDEAIRQEKRVEDELANMKKTIKATSGRSSTPDFDEHLPAEVSSSNTSHVDRKKDVKRHKMGLRGSMSKGPWGFGNKNSNN